jgi:hypothetical protein
MKKLPKYFVTLYIISAVMVSLGMVTSNEVQYLTYQYAGEIISLDYIFYIISIMFKITFFQIPEIPIFLSSIIFALFVLPVILIIIDVGIRIIRRA